MVLKMGQMKRAVIAGSEVLELEMSRMQDNNKKQKVFDLYRAQVCVYHIQIR